MCLGCWDKYGSEAIDTPDVRLAARLVAEVYEHSCVGGNLHVVVDDWNLEDGHLEACAGTIRDNFFEGSPEQVAAEWAAWTALRGLTEEERASALALHDGGWTITGAEESR